MKKIILNSVVLSVIIVGLAAPAKAYTPGIESTGLYRLYNSQTGEHFYTTSSAEVYSLGVKYDNQHGGFMSNGAFTLEGVEGKVFRPGLPNQLPLYRLYNPTSNRHFYTTNNTELETAKNQGFTLEGIEGYLSTTVDEPGDGSTMVNFYRLYNKTTNDHFYTKNPGEVDAAVGTGYVREVNMGYIAD
jgi:hypothetical protein